MHNLEISGLRLKVGCILFEIHAFVFAIHTPTSLLTMIKLIWKSHNEITDNKLFIKTKTLEQHSKTLENISGVGCHPLYIWKISRITWSLITTSLISSSNMPGIRNGNKGSSASATHDFDRHVSCGREIFGGGVLGGFRNFEKMVGNARFRRKCHESVMLIFCL